MYYFLKMVTEKSPVKWSYPLFLESAKLEFHCIRRFLLVPYFNALFSTLEILLHDLSSSTTYKVRVTGVDYVQNTPCAP